MSRPIGINAMNNASKYGAIGYDESEVASNADLFPTFNEQQSFDGIDRTQDHTHHWEYGEFLTDEELYGAETTHAYNLELQEIKQDMENNPHLYYHQDDIQDSNTADYDDLPF